MKQFTADELRKAWKQFYIDRGSTYPNTSLSKSI